MLLSLLFAGLLQCPDGTPPPCRSPQRAAAPRANSVAVLYFENNSPDTGDVYLADGLTDELITQLGRIRRLTLASRTAVRRFRGRAEDPVALARGLAVSHLVSGSVRRAGDILRVDVELVRMPGQRRLWGESYQRTDGNVFAIQEDIARSITRAVAGTLLPAERAQLSRAPTSDPIAYDLYLRGSRAMDEVSPAAFERARQSFEEALRRDPAFAAARGRLAYVYSIAVNWSVPFAGLSTEDLIRRGLDLADQALREEPRSSDAWLGRSSLLFHADMPDYAGALDAARRAVALDSGNSWARLHLAVWLRRLGEFGAAERENRRVRELEPASDLAFGDLATMQLQFRRYDQARRWYDSALARAPDSWAYLIGRARAALRLGDTAAARADAGRAVAVSSPAVRHMAESAEAGLLARLGDTTRARAQLASVTARFAAGAIPVREGFELAAALVGAGWLEQAVEVLGRIRPRGAWLWSYLVYEDFDPLRRDPRFTQIFNEARPPRAPELPS